MTYLEKLLDGAPVAWKPLGEVCGFRNGFAFRHNTFQEKGLPIIRISDIQEGKVLLDKTVFFDLSDYKEDLAPYELKRGDVVISLSGIIKTALVDFESSAYLNQRVGKFLPKQELLNHKFLYYYLERKNKELQKMAVGRIPPNLSSVRLMKEFLIPLPPLPVQEHIVGILDKYTALEAELEKELAAELEARKRQYRYYRNKLLRFGEETPNVRWCTLGGIGTFVRGNGLQKKDFVSAGIPCIHYGQIYTHYGMFAEETLSFVSEEAAQKFKKAQPGDLIIATTSENVRDLCKTVVWLGKEEICVSGETYIFKHNQNPKYLAFYLQTPQFERFKRVHFTGTTVYRLHRDWLSQFPIPLPPLAVQEQIVAMLSKYDTFVHSLSEGLPAEVKMRRKQYEHYRRLLLDFPKPRQ